MEETLDAWFAREILSHETAFSRFIWHLWPHHDEQADFRQEAYARVFQAARKVRPEAPMAFLFVTARNLIADRVRRNQVVSIRTRGELANVLIDEISPEHRVAAALEFAKLAEAFECLSSRSQEVLWLRRVEGLSQREVAGVLRISEKTVEKHMRAGTRELARLTGGGE